jgi:DNA-binding NtrC family response regulator
VSEGTTLRRPAGGIPVRAIRANVVAGPDAPTSVAASAETLAIGTAEGNDLRLSDPSVSRYHCELSLGGRGVEVRDLDSTNGTYVAGTRIYRALLTPGTELSLGDTRLRVLDGGESELPLHAEPVLAGLVGGSHAMRRLMAKIERAAQTDVGVLVTGESGTGKELVARALHELGPRRGGPLVTVDCGALAPTLVASELFGHERGAFTGAQSRRIGAFEQANGGTLFLDEVGELPAQLQATLLGVLERRRFRRLGGADEVSVDVRVVSATHRDLRADVNAERFRLDLYYRLAVVTLPVPPLRDRIDDVPALARRFAREAGADDRIDQLLSDRTLDLLTAHRWPGNVRELRNWVEAAVALDEVPDLDGTIAERGGVDPIDAVLDLAYKDARGRLVHAFEERYLARLLERAGGNVSEAARLARMDRSHLNDLLRRHGLR